MKQKRSIGWVIACVVLGFVGVLMFGIGAFFTIHASTYKSKGIKTEAYITDIDEYYDYENVGTKHNKKQQHDVYVEYYAEGEFYEVKLGAYNSSMKVGDTVEVYYMEDNPGKIVDVKTELFVGIILWAVSVVVLIVFFICLVKSKPN